MSIRVLGLWNMGDDSFHRLLSPTSSKKLIREALKLGIRSFDSAFSYKSADNYLASVLKDINKDNSSLSIKREDIEIISKVMPVPTLKKKAITSLNRLQTNYFDSLLIHWPTNEKALYSSLKDLEELQNLKITKQIGVSNFPLDLLIKVMKDFPITIHERALSLIWNKDYNKETSLGLKTYAYAPLGMGTLAKDNPFASFDDSRKDLYIFNAGINEYRELIDTLKDISISHSCSIADISLAWVDRLNPYAIVFGATRKEQLGYNKINLSDEEFNSLSSLASKLCDKAPKDNIFSHSYCF